MHHVVHHMNSGDQMTEQLNQQELSRISGGNTTPPPAPSAAPAPGSMAPPPPAK